jgi:hypothetical protein
LRRQWRRERLGRFWRDFHDIQADRYSNSHDDHWLDIQYLSIHHGAGGDDLARWDRNHGSATRIGSRKYGYEGAAITDGHTEPRPATDRGPATSARYQLEQPRGCGQSPGRDRLVLQGK